MSHNQKFIPGFDQANKQVSTPGQLRTVHCLIAELSQYRQAMFCNLMLTRIPGSTMRSHRLHERPVYVLLKSDVLTAIWAASSYKAGINAFLTALSTLLRGYSSEEKSVNNIGCLAGNLDDEVKNARRVAGPRQERLRFRMPLVVIPFDIILFHRRPCDFVGHLLT